MENFNEYVENWFEGYMEEHPAAIKELSEFENGEEIYEHLFAPGNDCGGNLPGIPTTEDFLRGMFMQYLDGDEGEVYSYMKMFMEDMAYHCSDCQDPVDFFNDLAYGGCQSGMIGMLVYNPDCKKIYIDNIDDMESFVSDIEDETGDPIRNPDSLPRYTLVCWCCYEELAYRLASVLFPENF